MLPRQERGRSGYRCREFREQPLTHRGENINILPPTVAAVTTRSRTIHAHHQRPLGQN